MRRAKADSRDSTETGERVPYLVARVGPAAKLREVRT